MGSGADKGKETVCGDTIYKIASVEPDVGLEGIITCCRVELTTVTGLVGSPVGAAAIGYSRGAGSHSPVIPCVGTTVGVGETKKFVICICSNRDGAISGAGIVSDSRTESGI
jgi:hypothetical protein